MAVLAGMGVPLKYGHGEVGAVPPAEGGGVAWEQHEIEMDLAPLPEAADAVVLARWVVGTLARREGLLCSFAPLLREGHAGNGLHFHFAPVVGGRPAEVRGEDGGLAPAARRVVAGLVRAGDALMAFGNRVPESFLRLAQARETPASIAWGDGDRSAMVRLPARRRTADGRPAGAETVEFRLPDGSAHPHLLLAGAAQAIVHAAGARDLDAVLEASASGRRGPGGPLVTTVPRTFREVAEALSWHRASLEAGGVFPPAMLDALVARLSA
jgi:glutamine synthetase